MAAVAWLLRAHADAEQTTFVSVVVVCMLGSLSLPVYPVRSPVAHSRSTARGVVGALQRARQNPPKVTGCPDFPRRRTENIRFGPAVWQATLVCGSLKSQPGPLLAVGQFPAKKMRYFALRSNFITPLPLLLLPPARLTIASHNIFLRTLKRGCPGQHQGPSRCGHESYIW